MHKYFNPLTFTKIIDKTLKYLIILTISFLLAGLYFAIFKSPADYQQGEAVRIMYVHVPSAWMALFIYSFMACFSASYLIWKNPLADTISRCAAPIGSSFAFITLVTGSLWGKPIWGTWWVWDARLTSMLILQFFYLGYISFYRAANNKEENAKNLAILALIGFVNVPIVKFSVNFWNSLHQPASIIRASGPSIHITMLLPLLLMLAGCLFYFLMILAIKVKTELVNKKINRLQQEYYK